MAIPLGQQHVEQRVDAEVQVLQHGADEVKHLPGASLVIQTQVHTQLQHITGEPAH